MPGTLFNTEDTRVNKTDKIPVVLKLAFYWGDSEKSFKKSKLYSMLGDMSYGSREGA